MAVLGFPDGSLLLHTKELLEAAGMEIPSGLLRERRYRFPLSLSGSHPFTFLQIVRPQDMPLAVSVGMVDAGISGMDWLIEACALAETLKVLATFN
ncbi:MAG: hypothetical protein PHP21_02310, partial [Patescibacteria group bacterium]|nr:hypothetical protein [Patescibacteria group bacterium]